MQTIPKELGCWRADRAIYDSFGAAKLVSFTQSVADSAGRLKQVGQWQLR